MKTIEQLYNEIMKNQALKEKFVAAARENGLADFLRDQDCDASVKDVMDFMNGIQECALNDDNLDKVAGGRKADTREVCKGGSC